MGGPKFHRFYDNAVPSDLCKRVIEAFEKDKDGQQKGMLLDRTVRSNLKECTDICIGVRIGQGGIGRHLWAEIDAELYKCVAKTWEQYWADTPSLQFISTKVSLQDTGYQLQRYEPRKGHFGPHVDAGSIDSAFRIAAAVIYFNTVKQGGGTHFPIWGDTVDAVEGRILWFPATWTHVHEGLPPLSERKYIASTFMCFKGYQLLDCEMGPCYRHIMNVNAGVPTERPEPIEQSE